MATILLVDDEPLARGYFRVLLERKGGHKVIDADCGEAALRCYPLEAPAVVVMDLRMPGMNGLEATRELLSRDSQARVIILSAEEDSAWASAARQAGAKGYVSKLQATKSLLPAVAAVLAGGEAGYLQA
jgi:two-component system invasion response regulator UvrY